MGLPDDDEKKIAEAYHRLFCDLIDANRIPLAMYKRQLSTIADDYRRTDDNSHEMRSHYAIRIDTTADHAESDGLHRLLARHYAEEAKQWLARMNRDEPLALGSRGDHVNWMAD